MVVNVEKLPVPPLTLGEGPHWHVASQSLYFVDITNSVLLRYEPKTSKLFQVKLEVPLASFIIPVSGCNGKFVVGSGINLYLISWNGFSDKVDSIELLHKLTNDSETNRINDGKCDATGRLWFGTMSINDYFTAKTGKFYSYSKTDGCREYASGVGVSNGLTWKGDMMYYIDSQLRKVDGFDYDANGNAENRRTVFDFEKNDVQGYPDGMTIDKDGNLWVACYTGSQVIRIDPKTGELLNKIEIPTPLVTSMAWAGPNLEDLYVTSADNPEVGVYPNAGCTFRVTGLSTCGLPMSDFKL